MVQGDPRTFPGGARVPAGGAADARVRGGGEAAAGGRTYLSELPGSVNVAHDGVVRPQADPGIHRSINPYGESTRSAGARPIYAGWGGAAADRGPYGHALSVAGLRFDTGLGVLANSRLEVRNEGRRRFRAEVGVDDNTLNPDATVVMQVFGDGRLLAASAPLRFDEAVVALEADVSGVKLLELVARQEEDRARPAMVVWGDAALLN